VTIFYLPSLLLIFSGMDSQIQDVLQGQLLKVAQVAEQQVFMHI
jgi:hypothetical protein